VKAGDDQDSVSQNPKEDAIRKSPNERPAGISQDDRKPTRVLCDRLQGDLNRRQELLTQARLLRLVPSKRVVDVSGCCRTK